MTPISANTSPPSPAQPGAARRSPAQGPAQGPAQRPAQRSARRLGGCRRTTPSFSCGAMEYGKGTWFSFESKVPLPQLENHSAVLVGGRMIYLFGGNSGNDQYNTLHVLNAATMELSMVTLDQSSPQPRGRSAHTATVYKNRLHVLYGWGGTGNELNDLQVFDLEKSVWSAQPTSGDAPSARHWQTASLVGNRLFVFGGYDGQNQRNDLYVLNMDSYVWTRVLATGDVPCKRANHKAVVVGNLVYVIGGWNGTGACEGVHMLNTETCEWTLLRLTGSGPMARTGCEAALYKNHIICFGGKDSNKRAHNDVFALNLLTKTWHTVVTTGGPPSERMNTAGLVVGDRLIFVGGNCDGRKQNDINVLELSNLLQAPDITVPASRLSEDLALFVDNKEHSDVTFLVENRPIYAHKTILCARSQYFRMMFSHDMSESISRQVVVPDTKYETFLALLRFLYTDSETVELGGALELLRLSNLYDVPRLSALIEMEVAKHIDVDTVCAVFQEADTYKCGALRDTCLRFILHHFDSVSKVPAFLDLRRELMFEVLQKR